MNYVVHFCISHSFIPVLHPYSHSPLRSDCSLLLLPLLYCFIHPYPSPSISFLHTVIHQFLYSHSPIHPRCHFLILQLADLSIHCSQYFSRGTAGKQEERFLSETSEAYAFGSNSSSQLAMGTQEKVLEATHMPHMANCQVVR